MNHNLIAFRCRIIKKLIKEHREARLKFPLVGPHHPLYHRVKRINSLHNVHATIEGLEHYFKDHTTQLDYRYLVKHNMAGLPFTAYASVVR